MSGHRMAFHGAHHPYFSERPVRVWPAACFILIAGTAGAAACSAIHLLFPAAAPFLCGVAAALAMFAVAFFEVHRRRWVDPVSLVKAVYFLGVFSLGGLFVGRAWLGLTPLPIGADGAGPGIGALVAITLAVPVLLVLPAVLAAGDRAPPPDESRLDDEPRL